MAFSSYGDYPDYYDCKPSCECEYCKNEYYMQDFLGSIVEQLFNKEPVDNLRLENDLEELCHYLGVKFPAGDLRLVKVN